MKTIYAPSFFLTFLVFASSPSVANASMPQPVQALSAADFLDSFGINTHIGGPNATLQVLATELNYTGIRHVRDSLTLSSQIPAMQQLNALAGVKFDLGDGYKADDGGSALIGAQLTNLEPVANLLEGIEGPNEPDMSGVFYNGTTGAPAVISTQQFLYATVKADAFLKDVPVLSPALSYPALGGLASLLGNLAPFCDASSVHIYPENRSLDSAFPAGSLATPYGFIAGWLTFPASVNEPGRPEIITEGGWSTDVNSTTGVDEATQAKYYGNYLLDSFSLGIRRTYMYELIDDNADTEMTADENHYGIFHVDGSPKPAATLLANLHALLSSQSFSPGILSYSLYNMSAAPNNLHQLLLQQSNGNFVLAVWNEGTSWDSATQKDTPLTLVPISINLAETASSITVYDPTVGIHAVSAVQNSSGLTLEVPDHPILITIVPLPPQSISGTTLPGAASIIDATGAVWTLSNGAIYENGSLSKGPNNVAEVIYDQKVVYAHTTSGMWYYWNGNAWIYNRSDAESVSGTTLPGAASIIDAKGNVWTLNNGKIFEYGSLSKGPNNVAEVIYDHKVVYAHTTSGMWYYWNGNAWIYNRSDAESVSGTTLPGAASIIDAKGDVWTLNNGKIFEDGSLSKGTSKVAEVIYDHKVVYAHTTSGMWYYWNGNAWIYNRSDAESASGTILPGAASIIDANGDVWTLNNGKIFENGVLSKGAEAVTFVEYSDKVLYQHNAANVWYYWNGNSWIYNRTGS